MTEQQRSPYRVWWVPQVPGKAFDVEVPDVTTARLMCDTLARYDLFQYENKIKPDYANVGGVQRWNENENEWEDMDEDEVLAEWGREEVERRWPGRDIKMSDGNDE